MEDHERRREARVQTRKEKTREAGRGMSLLRGSARIRKEDSNQSAVPWGQMGGMEKSAEWRQQAGFIPERRVC